MKYFQEVPLYIHTVPLISLLIVGCGWLQKIVKVLSNFAVVLAQQTGRCIKAFRRALDEIHREPERARPTNPIRRRRPTVNRKRRRKARSTSLPRRARRRAPSKCRKVCDVGTSTLAGSRENPAQADWTRHTPEQEQEPQVGHPPVQ
jgi:hypothetical protein